MLKKDSVVIDVGANVGGHTVAFANTSPSGKIFAFEPSLDTYKILVRNTKKFKNVTTFQSAISEKTGMAYFYEAYDSGYSGLKNTGRKKISKVYTVPTISIDNLVKNKKLDRLDLIKIDVEGTEASVIQGARETIKKFHPIIMCEICDDSNSSQKTIDLIKSFGYKSHIIKEGKVESLVSYNPSYYNYLFIK